MINRNSKYTKEVHVTDGSMDEQTSRNISMLPVQVGWNSKQRQGLGRATRRASVSIVAAMREQCGPAAQWGRCLAAKDMRCMRHKLLR